MKTCENTRPGIVSRPGGPGYSEACVTVGDYLRGAACDTLAGESARLHNLALWLRDCSGGVLSRILQQWCDAKVTAKHDDLAHLFDDVVRRLGKLRQQRLGKDWPAEADARCHTRDESGCPRGTVAAGCWKTRR